MLGCIYIYSGKMETIIIGCIYTYIHTGSIGVYIGLNIARILVSSASSFVFCLSTYGIPFIQAS